MLHVVPNEDKVGYARSLVRSIGTILDSDDLNNLSDHDLNMVITSLEIAYEIGKGVLRIRESRQTWDEEE